MITRRPLLLGAAAAGLLVPSAWAQAADFSGDWHGALVIGPTRLRLRLNIGAGPAATLYSLDQGGAPIPVSELRIEGDSIFFAIAVISASYQGRLANGRIEGTFTQGAVMPLTFGREEIAGTPRPPSEPLTQERLAAIRAQFGAPAMAAAAANRDGRSISFADGLRAAGQPQAVTTSDKWHLGSITKSMTSTLVARLAERREVSWDDTLGDVLGPAVPNMRDEYRQVSLRHLCSHHSGLSRDIEVSAFLRFPRYDDDPRQDRVELTRIALAAAPVGPAEATFMYSNSGYIIAGAMLEARMGAKWEDLIREHVFTPLGMASAGQGAPGTPGAYDQPVGHGVGPIPFPPGGAITDNPAVLGPAGRVHASLEDVLKYLAAHRDRTSFLRPESWQVLHTPPFGDNYAMGWVKRGNDSLWHDGSNLFWYAQVGLNPARGVMGVAAANDGRLGEITPAITAVLGNAVLAVV